MLSPGLQPHLRGCALPPPASHTRRTLAAAAGEGRAGAFDDATAAECSSGSCLNQQGTLAMGRQPCCPLPARAAYSGPRPPLTVPPSPPTHLAVECLEAVVVVPPHHMRQLVQQRLADAVVAAEAWQWQCGRARSGAGRASAGGPACTPPRQQAPQRRLLPLYPRPPLQPPLAPTLEVVGVQAERNLLSPVDVDTQDAHRADPHLALRRHLAASARVGAAGKVGGQHRQR